MFSDSSSPTLILGMVSKFLTKLFERDPNSSKYMSQWESFFPLLISTPLDISPVYSFIDNMEVEPFDDLQSFKISPTEIKIHGPRDTFNLLGGMDLNGSFSALSAHSMAGEDKTRRRHSLFDPKTHLAPSVDIRRNISHKPSQFSHRSYAVDTVDDFGGNFTTKDLLSDITHEDSIDYTKSLLESPTYTLTEGLSPSKHNLSSLIGYSMRLKDNIINHSNEVANVVNKQNATAIMYEARSPLRSLRVYGLTAEAGSYQQNQPSAHYANVELGKDYLQMLKLY